VAPYHIYLVDNGSRSETTKSYLDRWEGERDVTVRRLDSNHGPPAARNLILDMAGGGHEVFAMLDNDIVVLDGWDRAIEPAFSEGFSVVQPKLLNPDRETVGLGPTRAWPVNWLVHPQYFGRGASRNAPEVSERRTVDTFGGTAIIHRKVLEATGGYDNRIWVGDDYDLAYRATAAGFVACYEPSCEMVHDHGYDFEYDQMRYDPLRALVSHALLWEKHKRLLLPHSDVKFYLYLVENDRPMFIPHKSGWDAFFARAWRRAVRSYFYRRYGEVWPSREAGERATEDVLDRLHYRFPALDFRPGPGPRNGSRRV
jgi:GT2 family glycosyltransferase